MILAVMTRVALGHTGRQLHAAGLTVLAYLVFNLAVIGRFIGYFSEHYLLSIEFAASTWIASFLLFLWVYGPILTGPKK